MMFRAAKTSNELATERTHLAVNRTLMAAERSLMAWMRTALSMLGFGFTIYKILEGFKESGALLPRQSTPQNIGLFLTGLGTVSILMGTIEYWATLKDLRREEPNLRPWRPSYVMALIMCVTSLFFFVSVVTRLL